MCPESSRSQAGCKRRGSSGGAGKAASPWPCSSHGERVRACDAYAWHEQSARRWSSQAKGSASPPFFPLLRVSVWLNKRVVVVLLCYRLAKPEQELVLRCGLFMASKRLGVVVPVFPSRLGSVRPGLGLVRMRCVCSVSRSGNALPLRPLRAGTRWRSWRVRLAW